MLRLVLSEYDSFERKIGDEIASETLSDDVCEAEVIGLLERLVDNLNDYQSGNWEHEPVSVRLTAGKCVVVDAILR